MNKKLLIIINSLGVGGAERLIIDDIHELQGRGVHVDLVTLKREKTASLKETLVITNGRWTIIPFSGLWDVQSWWRLWRLIRDCRPDVVMTHLWFANTIGRLAAYLARVPTIISFEHGFNNESGRTWMFWVDRILQYLSTAIVAVSEATKQMLVARGIRSTKVQVILNGIDVCKYQNAAPARIREELKLGERFIFLSVGSLRSPQKNMDILLRAFAQVETGVLLIAGDGRLRRELEALAQQLHIGQRVYFLGSRNDVPNLLKSANCFVLLSRFEGLPLVVMEAKAAGVPIIVSDFDSAREVITHRVDGLMVKRGDILATSAMMRELVAQPELAERLASTAAKAANNLSTAQHIDNLLRLIA